MDPMVLRHWVEELALVATLAIAFGMAKRLIPNRTVARLLLGLAFGLFATFLMLDPHSVAPGVIIDMRSVPVALAAGFLGLEGTLACVAVALASRWMIGGSGMVAGMAGIITVALVCRGWSLRFGLNNRHSLVQLGLLGLLSAAGLPCLLLVPGGAGWDIVARIGPYFVPMHLIGTAAVGWAIDRERMLLRQEKQLMSASLTDPLTGLLNRRGFERQVARDGLTPRHSAVLLIDIDRFKDINDSLGHLAGDRVLAHVARLVRSAVGRSDPVGRLGGDELVLALRDTGPAACSAVADRMCALVAEQPCRLEDGVSVAVTISIGFAMTQEHDDLPELLKRADAALYLAKREGRNCARCDQSGAAPAQITAAA